MGAALAGFEAWLTGSISDLPQLTSDDPYISYNPHFNTFAPYPYPASPQPVQLTSLPGISEQPSSLQNLPTFLKLPTFPNLPNVNVYLGLPGGISPSPI